MNKNRILYLSLLLLSICFVYFYGGLVPYAFLYLIMALPVISFLYTLLVYSRFKYIQEIDRKFVSKGEKVNFIFSVHNEDAILFPYLTVSFCGADSLFRDQFQVKSFSILPFSKKSFTFELECKYRGTYDIGIKSIELYDFLGILKLKYKHPEPKYVTVYPKIVTLNYFHLDTDFASESLSALNSSFEDLSSIDYIRKYGYGDSLKKIHWKLSAKYGELLVKKYQSTSETSAVIFLDLYKNSYDKEFDIMLEDKVIESAAAVLSYCYRSGIPVKLAYYEEKLIEFDAKDAVMLEEIFKILAKVKFDGSILLKDILEIYFRDNIIKSNIVIFTSNIDYNLCDILYRAGSAGFNICLVYVSPNEADGKELKEEENMLSYLTETGITNYKLNINDDLKKVLEKQV